MMDAFDALLEARDPARGCFRSYRVQAGTDLLGDWRVEVTFGSIGAGGRRVAYPVDGEAGAQRCVAEKLRRRATAPRRIDTAHVVHELHDPASWASEVLVYLSYPLALDETVNRLACLGRSPAPRNIQVYREEHFAVKPSCYISVMTLRLFVTLEIGAISRQNLVFATEYTNRPHSR